MTCLARWAMWSVEAWDSDDLNNLKRDVVTTLMQALGHGLSENENPMPELVSGFPFLGSAY